MPLFYVKIRKNIDICNYLPIYYPAICRGWGTFSVPSLGRDGEGPPVELPPLGEGMGRGRQWNSRPLGRAGEGLSEGMGRGFRKQQQL